MAFEPVSALPGGETGIIVTAFGRFFKVSLDTAKSIDFHS